MKTVGTYSSHCNFRG